MSMEPLNDDIIKDELVHLPGWFKDGQSLRLDVAFPDFRQAFQFMTGIAFLAESHGHHPEMFNVYNKVSLRLSTHDAGHRITRKDIDLARAILPLTSNE
jgi:4a-hydroxytetrahydrobiopterin dehydratase